MWITLEDGSGNHRASLPMSAVKSVGVHKVNANLPVVTLHLTDGGWIRATLLSDADAVKIESAIKAGKVETVPVTKTTADPTTATVLRLPEHTDE